MKDKRGFSLIELLAILIIIGLILIVALPAISRLLKSNNTKQYDKYVDIIEKELIYNKWAKLPNFLKSTLTDYNADSGRRAVSYRTPHENVR